MYICTIYVFNSTFKLEIFGAIKFFYIEVHFENPVPFNFENWTTIASNVYVGLKINK